MKKIWLTLVPDLERIHLHLRDAALRKASRSELQPVELISMAIWLIVVSVITRSILQGATDDNRLTFTIVTNLVFTAPALLAAFIPIHIRRIRRDIRKQLQVDASTG